MAIEIHGQMMASGVRVFLLKSTNTQFSLRHQLIRRPTILIALLQDADFVYYSFKLCLFRVKKGDAFSLPCNFM